MDFVNTIKEDTTRVLNTASGAGLSEEEEAMTVREKNMSDLKRNFDTYRAPIEEVHAKEFEKYLRSFSLSSQAAEIASILDEEPDVARFYAELVPVTITPVVFWARYFFRLALLARGGVVSLEDEEEDLAWESTDKDPDELASPAGGGSSNGGGSSGAEAKVLQARVRDLESENAQLKGQVKTLALRIADLESMLDGRSGNGAISGSSSSSSSSSSDSSSRNNNSSSSSAKSVASSGAPRQQHLISTIDASSSDGEYVSSVEGDDSHSTCSGGGVIVSKPSFSSIASEGGGGESTPPPPPKDAAAATLPPVSASAAAPAVAAPSKRPDLTELLKEEEEEDWG